MTRPGISFAPTHAAPAGLSSRADVAMFVGCVAPRPGAAPTPLDTPAPVESWSQFDALFAWERRPMTPGSPDMTPTPLGLAVKGFFDEGGAKAYIVRTGDPMPLCDPSVPPEEYTARLRRLLSWAPGAPPEDAAARAPILPGFGGLGRAADPADPATWTGAANIYAADDCALLLLPDLPDLCGGAPQPVVPLAAPPGPPEQFRPCAVASPDLTPQARAASPDCRAPRLDRDGYRLWADALRHALDLLGRPRGAAHRRDVMLLAALPLPSSAAFDAGQAQWPLSILDEAGSGADRLLAAGRIGSARLQLAYPWVETRAARAMPERLQSPEGILAGMIARTALADGAFRSAAGRPCLTPIRTSPEIGTGALARGLPDGRADWLGDRICLIGMERGVMRLLSDATASADRAWRAGGVSRLMGVILRGVRRFGDDLAFEPSGPALWGRVSGTMETFLDGLWRSGALDGRTRAEAFEVICGRDSMTQADIDAGRVICSVGFTAAWPIQRIAVSLLMVEAPPQGDREAA